MDNVRNRTPFMNVGSLKRANIGLAIINNKEPSKEDKKKRKTMSNLYSTKIRRNKT
jgi:hypothetical protein